VQTRWAKTDGHLYGSGREKTLAEQRVGRWLFGNAFYYALRCKGPHYFGKPVTRCGEQALEFTSGAFSSSSHYQHVQIEELTEAIRIALRYHHFDQQHFSVGGHCFTTISQDSYSAIVVPIVDHTAQEVSVGARRHRNEEISRNE